MTPMYSKSGHPDIPCGRVLHLYCILRWAADTEEEGWNQEEALKF